MIGSRFSLLGIEATIGIVVEHGAGLTIPTVDYPPPINGAWLAGVVLEDGVFAPFFCVVERRHN